MNWKNILKEGKPDRYLRYLAGQPKRGRHTTKKKQPCDKCGAMVAGRNVKASKRGEHINLCRGCKTKEE
jgi:hypothetical protein